MLDTLKKLIISGFLTGLGFIIAILGIHWCSYVIGGIGGLLISWFGFDLIKIYKNKEDNPI